MKLFAPILSAIAVIAITSLQTAAADDSVFKKYSLISLQGEPALNARLQSRPELTAYLKSVGDAADGAVGKLMRSRPSSGYLVVAIKPGAKSKFWLDMKPALSSDQVAAIVTATQAIPAAGVKQGVIVFAYQIGLWGGVMPKKGPAPVEWKAAAATMKQPIEASDLVQKVWPD